MQSTHLCLLAMASLSGLVLAQESQQRFRAPLVVGDADERFEALLDLDADGDLDLIGWWWQGVSPLKTIEISARFNDGTGQFSPGWAFDSAFANPGQSGFQVCDLDGDGPDDFGIQLDTTLKLYRVNGTQLPTLYATHSVPSNAQNFVLADFDQDGRDDVAHGGNTGQIWLNQGAGQALILGADFPLLISPISARLSVVDANGDGMPDLMHVGQLGGQAVQFHFIAGGQEIGTMAVPHGFVGVEARMFTSGDVDNDGDTDVVVFCASGNYALLRRTGRTSFVADAVEVGGPATGLADINGDGFLDGICCGGGNPTEPENYQASQFELSLNDGTGRFAPAFNLPSLGAHHIAGAGDVDGDGDVDLAAGRVVYFARGPINGPITGPTLFEESAQVLAPIDGVDFDRDGDIDFRLALNGVLQNPGDGELLATTWTALPPPAGTAFLNGPGYPGDWDGDGDVDLICATYNGFVLQGMRLVTNNGSGVLSDGGPAGPPGMAMGIGETLTDVFPWPTGALRSDLDSDGDLDLALPHLGQVSLFWNDGQGYFTAGLPVPLASIETAADLNGDGRLDLIGHTLGQLAIAFSNAPQSFSQPVEQASLVIIESQDDVVVLDFEGDGDLDLVTQMGVVMALLLNDGFGQFTVDTTTLRADPQSGAVLSIENHPNPNRYLIGADVDGNGTTDLVAGPLDRAENASYVLLLDGQGGFSSSAQLLLASDFQDLDGDGDLDAIGPRVTWNNTVPNPGSGERQQYGSSSPVSCEVRPVLGASGPFRVGGTGVLQVSGVQAGAPGLMAVGLSASDLSNFPWTGISMQVWPWVGYFELPPAVGPGTSSGDGLSSFAYTIKSGWPGFGDLYHQAFCFDPCSAVLVTASNGLRLRYAP